MHDEVFVITPTLNAGSLGVVHLGEYDVCDVTLSVYPHRASLNLRPLEY
jgi:hypothetical protein